MFKKKMFCEKCRNLLIVNTDNEQLLFSCVSCGSVYKSEPDDSLRYSDVKEDNIMGNEKIIRKMKDDHANPKKYINCPKCGYGIAKQIRSDKEKRLINVCLSNKCNYIWVNPAQSI